MSSLTTTIEGRFAGIAAALPNLGAALPAIARAAKVAEGAALVAPALIADILALRASPSAAALEKLAGDLAKAWPTVTAAIAANTGAEPETADALNAAEAAANAGGAPA